MKSEKEYPHLPDEYNRLKALCYDQLKAEYGEDPAPEVTERLEKELSAINAFELSGVMLILSNLVKKAGLKRYEILARGTFGSSFAAWLCGLNPVDPLKTVLTLYPEFCFGFHWNKEPDIEICVADGKTAMLYETLKNLDGVGDVISPATETEQDYSCRRYIIPEGETAGSGQYTENTIPYFPLGISSLTQLRFLERCVELTGTDPESISLDDKTVWECFKQTEHQAGTDDLMLQTFSDLVRADSLFHSTGAWDNNQKALVSEQNTPVSDLITCREDVYEFCLFKLGMNPEEAFETAEKVRKGRGVPQELKDRIDPEKQTEFEKFKAVCDKTSYLWTRAHSYEQTVVAWRCAWYRINYPTEFYQIYSETAASQTIRGTAHI